MTIGQVLNKYTKFLQAKKIASASLDAEVLLAYVLKKPKEYLYTYPEKNLTAKSLRQLKTLVKRRSRGEPVAYLIKRREFYGLDFFVDKRVLIPRPETEMLVEEVVKAADRLQTTDDRNKGAVSCKPLTVVDIGTGSGCIAITLAKNLHQAEIIATDISKDALKIAKQNAKKHKVLKQIKFYHGNLLTPIKNKKNDVIIANLPYLTNKEFSSNTITSIKFEPKAALDGGKNGLDIYRKFFQQIKEYNIKNCAIFIEIGYRQTNQLKKYLLKTFSQAKIQIKKDLGGLGRVMIIKI